MLEFVKISVSKESVIPNYKQDEVYNVLKNGEEINFKDPLNYFSFKNYFIIFPAFKAYSFPFIESGGSNLKSIFSPLVNGISSKRSPCLIKKK